MSRVLWQPDPELASQSAMAGFMRKLNSNQPGLSLQTYQDLHQWSTGNREQFWQQVLDFSDIRLLHRGDVQLSRRAHFWQDQWFPDTRLNYAQNLLKYSDDHPALRFFDEAGNEQTLTYAALTAEVTRISGALRQLGIQTGDRVAGFAANRIETIVAMLATSSLGAVWSSCSPDFGANGIIDRFQQITPRVLFAVSSHLYAGRVSNHAETLATLAAALPSLEHIILFPDLYSAGDNVNLPTVNADCSLHQWQDLNTENQTPLQFHASHFNDPLFIMYSSGTTGVPKCIVHGTGGTLLQHRKEHQLHLNLKRSDVFFYFTTCGWMMWNWLVSGLASGATLVLFDGSPFHPQQDLLFSLIEQTGISIFGVSAKYFSACEKAGLSPGKKYRLDSVHTILSTGSPLPAQSYDYVYGEFAHQPALQSISGGTDIISCFVLGNPLLPVYRGEIQCAGLGMDVAIYDEHGQPVTACKGELVCRQSFPSMPTGFWNDPDAEKYREAYFSRFPETWTHGDFAEKTDRGSFIIYGRSDTVLNPGGVRIGTAEIYRQVEKLEQIVESVAIGKDVGGDIQVILFVRLQPGTALDDSLVEQLRKQIRAGASPRHVPAYIFGVRDIPRTLSGKVAEKAVREVINNRIPPNLDALANPDCLEEYREYARILDQSGEKS